jgi:mono/diheme cytochrome c family protein
MRPAGSRSRFFYGLLTGVAITALLVALLSAPLLLTHRDAGSLERDYAAFMRGLTTGFGSRDAGDNPVAGTPQAVGRGQTAYNGLCVQCHGATGRGNGVFGGATFPEAADLLDDTAMEMSDAQLFYVIKNGYGFSSMPGYGDQYSDEMLWSIVSYVRTLQSASDSPTGGDAARGAVQFRAQGCVNCHGGLPGQITINPRSTTISQTVRNGRPGMPCFSADRLSGNELDDIIAYVSTFPLPAGQVGSIGGARPSSPPPSPSGGGAAPPPSQAPSPCATEGKLLTEPGSAPRAPQPATPGAPGQATPVGTPRPNQSAAPAATPRATPSGAPAAAPTSTSRIPGPVATRLGTPSR